MQPNEGRLPPECVIRDDDGNITGYRDVHVRLFGGADTRKRGDAPWPSSGGRPSPTNWKIRRPPHDGDIREWELA